MKKLLRSLFSLLPLCMLALIGHAQVTSTLSVQGILKKANGVAVEDGTYNITFRLYTSPTGPISGAIWSENQSNVEVSSGIYSATLGETTPLNVPFNQLYYLGITIGSSELSPRILLTSAPYALSLIGVTNKFPSSGKVEADSVQVNGGVLARGGAPGLNGINKNGYAFSGNNGDKDSGLFSTADGRVSLYANNSEVVAATTTNVQINTNVTATGTVTANSLSLPNPYGISYNGRSDWRLVTEDYLDAGPNGWNVYNALSGQNNGWNNPSSAGAAPVEGSFGSFAGFYLYPSDNNQVLKKYFDLTNVGQFSYIKVKFKYYLIDTWGFGDDDRAWAAFADGPNGSQMRVCWDLIPSHLQGTGEFTTEFRNAVSFAGGGGTDNTINGEMTAFKSGNGFWLYFGAALDEATSNESYGVGMIEVWVK